MNKITIAVIVGTKREGRQSIKAANWVAELGRKRDDVEIVFVDPKDFDLPPDGAPEDGENPQYAEITAKADAFFIVTPEYNNSIPSSLKRLLDSGDANYVHKPVALAGVSSGPWGGVRVCLALQPVCHSLGLVLVKQKLYFPRVGELFDEAGVMAADQVGAYTQGVTKSYDELVWMAQALKWGRDNLNVGKA